MAISSTPFTIMHSKELARNIDTALDEMFGNDDVASDMPTKFKNCFKLPAPAKTASAPAAAQTQPENNSIRTTTTTNETVRTLRATASRSSSPSTMQDLKAQVLQ